jgi:hypothetical protein
MYSTASQLIGLSVGQASLPACQSANRSVVLSDHKSDRISQPVSRTASRSVIPSVRRQVWPPGCQLSADRCIGSRSSSCSRQGRCEQLERLPTVACPPHALFSVCPRVLCSVCLESTRRLEPSSRGLYSRHRPLGVICSTRAAHIHGTGLVLAVMLLVSIRGEIFPNIGFRDICRASSHKMVLTQLNTLKRHSYFLVCNTNCDCMWYRTTRCANTNTNFIKISHIHMNGARTFVIFPITFKWSFEVWYYSLEFKRTIESTAIGCALCRLHE